MSTIQRIQLDRQAHDACALLAQAQYQLLVLRERQLQEADRERDASLESERRVELEAEATWERIDHIVSVNGLGQHGSSLEKLTRLAGLLDTYAKANDESQQEIDRLQSVIEGHNRIITELEGRLLQRAAEAAGAMPAPESGVP